MNASELVARVRRIEIKSRGLSREVFAGKYHTAFRGRGISFSEVREYQEGDDVRDIDWNVTARAGKTHVKVYEEERELTLMLLVDVSGSREFGSAVWTKKNILNEIAAVLAFSAAQNNDKVGCVLFSDRIEKYIPPKKGRQHVLTILRELVGFQPDSTGTKISEAVKFLSNVVKKRCTAFLLSDMFFDKDDALSDALKIAARKHDLGCVRVWDRREAELPRVGLIQTQDAETGARTWVDSSCAAVRNAYAERWERHVQAVEQMLLRARVDGAAVATDGDYVVELMKMFAAR